jgi:hypothetical protein
LVGPKCFFDNSTFMRIIYMHVVSFDNDIARTRSRTCTVRLSDKREYHYTTQLDYKKGIYAQDKLIWLISLRTMVNRFTVRLKVLLSTTFAKLIPLFYLGVWPSKIFLRFASEWKDYKLPGRNETFVKLQMDMIISKDNWNEIMNSESDM